MARVKKPHKYTVPSNYEQIKKLRGKGRFEVKTCPYLKESTRLRDYQTVGCLNLAMLKKMILGDDPGLGKTIQTLVAYGISKNFNPDLRLLVFTTKSAKKQWGREIDKFLEGISYHVMENKYRPKAGGKLLYGKNARRAQYEETKDKDVLIMGYYPLQVEPHILSESMGEGFMVVFDEVQAIKNHKSKAHAGAELLIESADRVYGLTATPIKNRLLEFYYIFKIVVPGLFPLVTRWKEEFTEEEFKFVPQKKGKKPRLVKEVVSYKNLDKFKEIIDPYFLRRSAEDAGKDLPGIITKKVDFDMSPAQSKLYAEALAGIVYEKRVRQTYFEMTENIEEKESKGEEVPIKYMERYERISEKYEEILAGDFLKNNKSSALAFCQLIANGPKWLGDEESGTSSKEEAFEDLVTGELYGQKVIVYTRFKSGIERLEKIIEKHGIKHVRVSGSESDSQREKAMEKFQDEDSGVEVIFITQAGSAAINLQRSGVMVFFDTPWSWGDLVQIIGRARRIGSEHSNVLVYHLVSNGTIDERVLYVLTQKKILTDEVLGKQAKGALEFDGVQIEVPEGPADNRGEVDILFDDIFS